MFTIKYANQEVKGKLHQFTPAQNATFLFEGNLEVSVPIYSEVLIATLRTVNLEKMQNAVLDVGKGTIELIQARPEKKHTVKK